MLTITIEWAGSLIETHGCYGCIPLQLSMLFNSMSSVGGLCIPTNAIQQTYVIVNIKRTKQITMRAYNIPTQ